MKDVNGESGWQVEGQGDGSATSDTDVIDLGRSFFKNCYPKTNCVHEIFFMGKHHGLNSVVFQMLGVNR